MSQAYPPTFTMNSQILLRPLSEQLENGVVVIGYGGQFVELPSEGLDFLHWLEEGLTLSQARDRFESCHSPFPDEEVIDVINTFLECDFVAAVDGRVITPLTKPFETTPSNPARRIGQILFSKPVLIAWMLFVIPATLLWVLTPELWPGRADYFWVDLNFIVVLVGLLVWLVDMSFHETAHWLAAKAKGISATITWTQRIGVLPMSQTVMHDIWAVPRPTRFLPLAAGMMWDVFAISIVLYLLAFNHIGLLSWPLIVIQFLKFYLLAGAMGLAAQFWLFSKMDGYFLLSALLGQRNLQADTYDWLKSSVVRTRSFDTPSGGMKFIYLYALITIVWGGLFLGQFLFINLHIQLQLFWQSLLKIGGGVNVAPIELADGVAVVTSQLIIWGLLIYAYWRDTLPNWRPRQQITNQITNH